jgi:hypothetical protein
MTEPCDNTKIPPTIIKGNNIGASHIFFLTFKNIQNSFKNSIFLISSKIDLERKMIFLLHLYKLSIKNHFFCISNSIHHVPNILVKILTGVNIAKKKTPRIIGVKMYPIINPSLIQRLFNGPRSELLKIVIIANINEVPKII